MDRLRVLVLASKPAGLAPGQRFRFEQWAPRLARDHGIDLDLLPFESVALSTLLYRPGHVVRKAAMVAADFLRRAGVVSRSKKYDAVLVFREAALIGPAIYERMIAATGIPVIFDFDDAIWTGHAGANNGLFSKLHFYGKTDTLCRIAAACTPGNAYLADYARKRNAKTFVIPTSIELDDYPLLPEPAEQERFIVCWTGSTSTLAHFELARAPLEKLAREIPLTVKVICNQPPAHPIDGAETLFVPWREEDEAQQIGASHVGIMPLSDDPFARGKCGLKALQYMATGRPVVVSPVGVNVDIIENGRNGMLATTADDYVDALRMLSHDPQLRDRLGRAGRETVETSYSAKVVAAKFADVVRFVCDSTRRPHATQ